MGFLKENAEYFEKKAFEALREKPRFVLFFTEQALQLYVKYILAKEFDDYPKAHDLRVLFQELAKIDDRAEKFYEENVDEERRISFYRKVREDRQSASF